MLCNHLDVCGPKLLPHTHISVSVAVHSTKHRAMRTKHILSKQDLPLEEESRGLDGQVQLSR